MCPPVTGMTFISTPSQAQPAFQPEQPPPIYVIKECHQSSPIKETSCTYHHCFINVSLARKYTQRSFAYIPFFFFFSPVELASFLTFSWFSAPLSLLVDPLTSELVTESLFRILALPVVDAIAGDVVVVDEAVVDVAVAEVFSFNEGQLVVSVVVAAAACNVLQEVIKLFCNLKGFPRLQRRH